ncbi:MAG: CHAD domain-containing protein [Armatimonadetes bacterium]|nr:CHAD domain-containing protein [Armatimonadota bacterium]
MAKAVPIHKLTKPDAPLLASAPVIRVRLGEVWEYAPAVLDPANVTELHDMRIAAKRLRYTVELFAPVLPQAEVKSTLARIADLQERLGAIHDADGLIALLAQTIEREEARERKKALRKKPELPPFFAAEGLMPLMKRKQGEREALYEGFRAWWVALPPEAFWAQVSALIPQNESEPPE